MVLNKEEFLASIKERIGEDTTDSSIKFLEDMTDTFDSLSKNSNEDWQKKYEDQVKKTEETESTWRKKYTDRFFDAPADQDKEPKVESLNDGDGDNTPKKFSDLFKEKES